MHTDLNANMKFFGGRSHPPLVLSGEGKAKVEFSVSMKKNHEFRRIYSKGKSHAAPALVLYCLRVKRPGNQLGITISAKIGNAVCRNKIRRRLREIYRLNEHRMQKGLDIVVVARAKSRYLSYAELEETFLHAASKLGILRRESAETSK